MSQRDYWIDVLFPITSSGETEVDLPGTTAVLIPVGNTSERPVSPIDGMLRYNTDTNEFEAYNGGWANLATSVGIILSRLEDADTDTIVNVEESGDEDIIRFDTGNSLAGYPAVENIMTIASSGWTVTMGTADTAGTVGAPISLTSGTGNTTGIGGSVSITAGDGGNAADGGVINITSGDAGSGSGADGGNVVITGGAGDGAGVSGKLLVQGPAEPGEIRLNDTAGGEFVGLTAPSAVSASYTLIFPSADAAGALTSDGAGNLSFAGGGSSDTIIDADADTMVQVEESADEDIIRFDTGDTPAGYPAIPDIMTLASSGWTVAMGTADTATTVGAPISLTSGTGNTSGAGGLIAITAGGGGDTGNGGIVSITAGSGGATSGIGGNVLIGGGNGSGGDNSGNIIIGGGPGTSGGDGGDVILGGGGILDGGGQPGQVLVTIAGIQEGQFDSTGLTLTNDLVLNDTGANSVAFSAPTTVTASYTLIMPDADAAGALTSDGAGNLSFSAGGAITDADGDTSIKVEDSPDEDIIRFNIGPAAVGEVEQIHGGAVQGTTGTIVSSVPITSDVSAVFEVFAIVREDGLTESAAFRIFGGVENNAGTAALIGTTQKDKTDDGGASVNWDVTVGVSGGNITVTVSPNTETVNCKVKVKIMELEEPVGG